MKKIAVFLIAVSFFISSCFPHVHVIGSGGTGSDTQKAKQWYLLAGLVPLNQVDTKEMAGEATDYTIKSKSSIVDWLIGSVTFSIVYPRTVEVTK